ncbi:hypothetical protein BI364_08690 [Acidihalobacter yilgarnensis]|uniref:Uncharacterized protein n=1 Tax=Acidihalobacter yilgarnensis TaxID=2819280 RepID=A0A1D8INI5_9GAMM|nr:VC1465 family Xer recombination activation factor [Acidihalobacter yilgarnensis]AOU98027.1 hypothetical protein BI364_08690 [Acidihalobacter yilgarnensis]
MNKAPNADQIHHQRRLTAGLSEEQAAQIAGVSLRTWRRWERGESPMPTSAWQWFRTVTDGLPLVKDWEGWGFKDGKLWSPENEGFTPGQIRSLTYLQALSKAKTGQHHFQPSDVLGGIDERLANHLKLLGKLDLIGLLLSLTYSEHLKHHPQSSEQIGQGLRYLIAGVQQFQQQQVRIPTTEART